MHPNTTLRRPPGRLPRRAVWILALLGRIVLMALIISFSVGTSIYAMSGVKAAYPRTPFFSENSPLTAVGVWLAVALFVAPFTLLFRGRWPLVPVIAGLIFTVVLQLDALLALMAMASLFGKRRGRAINVWAAVVAAAALWAGTRDGLRPASHSVVQTLLTLSMDSSIDPASVDTSPTLRFALAVGIAVTGCILAAAYGLIRRSQRELRFANESNIGERRRSQSLSTQVAQQDERELLAREVHDTLAHRLSLISLHSGSLDVATKSSDPGVATAAKVLQENAHQSLADLRNLIGMLRDPTAKIGAKPELPTPPTVGMADLAELLDSSRRAGLTINSTIMLSDITGASVMLDKAVFRIVQEAITNVHKHAPKSVVWLSINAVAQKGVQVRVANQITAANEQLAALGSGSGVIGIRERVRMFGGTESIGPDGQGNFVVQAWLPWQDKVGPPRTRR